MEIKSFITLKSQELKVLSEELTCVDISWEKPIIINCKGLTDIISQITFENYPTLFQNREYPAIYYFKIINLINGSSIIDTIEKHKLLKLRSYPKIDHKRNKETTYLYCGSVKRDLKLRLVQHLGFGHQQTYSLQLLHWTNEIELELEFNYAFLKKDERHLSELVEASLAMSLNPLVGKLVK